MVDAMPNVRKPRAAVIYNPIKIDRAKLNSVVEAAATKAGWGSTLWFQTSEDEPGKSLAEHAVAEGAAVVMAAGGDGTVRSVAEGLQGSGTPIALLPSGTGNVLARNLQLKLTDLERAVTLAFTGDERPIDIGIINIERPNGDVSTHAFLVMVGLGLDAEIMATTNSTFKKLFGWIAYVSAGMRSVARSTRFNAAITLDSRATKHVKAHTVVVGNCGVLPGNLILLPEAILDDGELDVIAFSPKGVFDWMKVWQRVVIEHSLEKTAAGRKLVEFSPGSRIRPVTYLRGKRTKLSVEQPHPCQLDGDPFGEAVSLDCTVIPGGLSVKVPAHSE